MSVHRLSNAAPKQAAPRRDQATSATISRLRHSILRMSLAYCGQNAELDRKLNEVRGLMRSGQRDPRLHKLIDQIVEIVCSMDHTRTRA